MSSRACYLYSLAVLMRDTVESKPFGWICFKFSALNLISFLYHLRDFTYDISGWNVHAIFIFCSWSSLLILPYCSFFILMMSFSLYSLSYIGSKYSCDGFSISIFFELELTIGLNVHSTISFCLSSIDLCLICIGLTLLCSYRISHLFLLVDDSLLIKISDWLVLSV